jgi:hypothetical protein
VPAFDDPLWVDIHRHRLRMLYTILSNGTKAVRGHVVYDEALHRRFENSHDFITILRDPIERFVSQYFYNKHVSRSRLSATFDDAELERVGPLWGSMMTFFLSGGPRSGALTVDVEDEQRVADAKEAVEALNVVGFVDRMEVFQRQLAAVTGLKLSVGRRNVRSSKDESEEERWIREAAPRFCAPDLEVYEHARAIWSTKS